MSAQRVIVETVNGQPVAVFIDNGRGQEYPIIVTEVARVYANVRRQSVRLEMIAEFVERERA